MADVKKTGSRLNAIQAAFAFLTTCNTNDRWLIELAKLGDLKDGSDIRNRIRNTVTSSDLLDMVKVPCGYPLETAKAFGDALGQGSGGLGLEGYKTKGPSPEDKTRIVDITHWYLTKEAGKRNRRKVEAFIVKTIGSQWLEAMDEEQGPKEMSASA